MHTGTGHTGQALWCSKVRNLLYHGCDEWTHVLSDYQSVVVCEEQTPISGAFESISSLEEKQKRLELAQNTEIFNYHGAGYVHCGRAFGQGSPSTLHLLVGKDPHGGPWQAALMLLESGGGGVGGQSPASAGLALSKRGLRQLAINFMHIINLSAFWRVGQIAHKVPLLSLAHGWAGEAEAHPGRQASARMQETWRT